MHELETLGVTMGVRMVKAEKWENDFQVFSLEATKQSTASGLVTVSSDVVSYIYFVGYQIPCRDGRSNGPCKSGDALLYHAW
jgi:hypothetical protein